MGLGYAEDDQRLMSLTLERRTKTRHYARTWSFSCKALWVREYGFDFSRSTRYFMFSGRLFERFAYHDSLRRHGAYTEAYSGDSLVKCEGPCMKQ